MTTTPLPEEIGLVALRALFFLHLYSYADAYNWTCPETDAVVTDRTCYIYNEDSLAWEDARKACVDKESILARVFSEENIREIMSQLPKASIQSASFSAWVGANDIKHERVFVWLEDNGTVIEDVWKGGEPVNTGDKDCAVIDSTMRLSVETCSELKPSLCMYMLREPEITKFMDVLPCRCSDGDCNTKGECPSSGKCLIGHFGPGCQFRNLHSNLHGKHKALNDNDISTCLSNLSQPLHIKFPHKHYFSWIRIVVEEKSEGNPFTMAFPVHSKYVDCSDQKHISMDNITFDIWCNNGPHVVNDFQITWDDNISICQIYFSGGRNMAFYVKAFSRHSLTVNHEATIDHIKGRGSEIMTTTHGYNYSHNVNITFGALDGIPFKIFYTHGPDIEFPTVWYRTDSDTAMNDARISINPYMNDDTRTLEIQEFENYGACPVGLYGLKCDMKCHKNCDHQGCLEIYGLCYRCKNGTELAICPDPTTTTTTTTTTSPTSTEATHSDNTTFSPTKDVDGMSRSAVTVRPPGMTTVVNVAKRESMWEYILYGLVSATTMLVVVPLLCLCHRRCKAPVEQPEVHEEAGPTAVDNFSDMDRKLTPLELIALSKDTKSKTSGISKSTASSTSGASRSSKGSRGSKNSKSYYSEAITDDTYQTQSTLIF